MGGRLRVPRQLEQPPRPLARARGGQGPAAVNVILAPAVVAGEDAVEDFRQYGQRLVAAVEDRHLRQPHAVLAAEAQGLPRDLARLRLRVRRRHYFHALGRGRPVATAEPVSGRLDAGRRLFRRRYVRLKPQTVEPVPGGAREAELAPLAVRYVQRQTNVPTQGFEQATLQLVKIVKAEYEQLLGAEGSGEGRGSSRRRRKNVVLVPVSPPPYRQLPPVPVEELAEQY